jgi:hypothetical protein
VSSTIDLRATITAHPWQAMAVALAAGAWLALEQPRAPRNALSRSLFATVGGITVGVARDLATRRFLGYVRGWLDEQLHATT